MKPTITVNVWEARDGILEFKLSNIICAFDVTSH